MEMENWDYRYIDGGSYADNDIFITGEHSYTGDCSLCTRGGGLYYFLNNIAERTTNTYGRMSMMVYIEESSSWVYRGLSFGSKQLSGIIGVGDWRYGIVGNIYTNGSAVLLRNDSINGSSYDTYNTQSVSLPSFERWYKIQLSWKRIQNVDGNYYWGSLFELIDQNTDEVISFVGSTYLDTTVKVRDVINNEYNVGITTAVATSWENYMDDWRFYES